MSLGRFVSLFAGAGLLIPMAFLLLWHWLDRSKVFSFPGEIFVENVMLMLWPSAIMNLAATTHDGRTIWTIVMASIITNVLLYIVIGFLIWLGMKYQRWILIIVFASLVTLWWRMLTL